MYCTLADITAMIPEEIVLQLTDDDNLGVIDQAKVDKAITDADCDIDGYCGTRYQVPFDVVPPIIVRICAKLAIYNLYARKVEVMPEVRAADKKNADKLLTDISKGTVVLPIGALLAPQEVGSIQTTSPARVFSRESLADY